MYCTSCGSKLLTGGQMCSKCGAHVPGSYADISSSDPTVITPLSDNGEKPSSSPAERVAFGMPQEEVSGNTFPVDYGSYPQSSQSSSPGQSNPLTPIPPVTPITPVPMPNTMYSYNPPPPPQNPYGSWQGGQQSSYVTTPVFPSPQGQKQPQRRRRGLVILSLILFILVMGSLGFVYYVGVYQPNVAHIRATATAQTQATAYTQATTVAQATTTAQTQATANAQATAAVENPYTSTGVLSFTDPLTDNSGGHQWDENGNCFFKNATYHAYAPNPNYADYCTAQATNVTNFAFEVQMDITQGDGGGISFRAKNDTSANHYYDLYVSQYGAYGVRVVNGPSTVLTHGSSTAIRQGPNQTNVLAVVAVGATIQVYINHQLVTTVNDSTYSSGQIGVEAVPFNPGGRLTDVVYSNLKVWAL